MNENSIFAEYDEQLPSEDKPTTRCDICGEPLYDGDAYYDVMGEKYCESCMKDAFRKIL